MFYLLNLLVVIFLVGCKTIENESSEAETESYVIKEEILLEKPENQVKPVDQININHPNNYLAKYDNEYTYVAGVDSLYRINSKDNKWEDIYKGNVRLGAFYDNALYFLSFPSDVNELNNKNSGVFKLDLTTLESEQILPWDENYWIYNAIQIEDGRMFLSSREDVIIYSIAQKQFVDNFEEIVPLPDHLRKKKDNGEISIISDLVFSYYSNGIISYIDNVTNTKTLCVYNVKENTEQKFEDVYNDVLFVQNGFVYRNEDRSKVYFVDFDKNITLLYDTLETNTDINYGTYDQNYLYCFEEYSEDNKVICYRISWSGEKEKLFETISSKGAVALNLTVINNYLYYYDEGKEKVVRIEHP